VNTRLSFGSAQPSNVAQFSVGALTNSFPEHAAPLLIPRDVARRLAVSEET